MSRKIVSICMVILGIALCTSSAMAFERAGTRSALIAESLFHAVFRGDVDALAALRDSGGDMDATLMDAGYDNVAVGIAELLNEVVQRTPSIKASPSQQAYTMGETIDSKGRRKTKSMVYLSDLPSWKDIPDLTDSLEAVIGDAPVIGLKGPEAAKLVYDLSDLVMTEADVDNWSLLMWAVFFQHEDVARVLVKSGASVNYLDGNRNTPLHWAAWSGNYAMVKFLLANGANRDVFDGLGRSPHDWAVNTGQVDVIRLLSPGPKILDSDGDGVEDRFDQCPGTPKGAEVDERGCWIAAYASFFDTNKAVIKKQYQPYLKRAADILKANPNIQVRIVGHADARGTEAYNQTLGMKRANAVKDLLVKYGVNAARMETSSQGELEPIATNKTAAGMTLNRRVEIHVKEAATASK